VFIASDTLPCNPHFVAETRRAASTGGQLFFWIASLSLAKTEKSETGSILPLLPPKGTIKKDIKEKEKYILTPKR
jgi:hypothetical protein